MSSDVYPPVLDASIFCADMSYTMFASLRIGPPKGRSRERVPGGRISVVIVAYFRGKWKGRSVTVSNLFKDWSKTLAASESSAGQPRSGSLFPLALWPEGAPGQERQQGQGAQHGEPKKGADGAR